MDYEKEIRIDESALDFECLNQADLMLKYTKHAAAMRKELDEAEEELGLLRAQIDMKIRKDPESFGIVKITETAVSNMILVQDDYQDALSNVNKARYEKTISDGAVKAFEQRKSMLEALIKLHGQSYFAGPEIPRNLSNEREEREQRNESINKKVKVRKKK